MLLESKIKKLKLTLLSNHGLKWYYNENYIYINSILTHIMKIMQVFRKQFMASNKRKTKYELSKCLNYKLVLKIHTIK